MEGRYASVRLQTGSLPYSSKLTASANEITDRLHPNSCSNGTISTPGVERIPAPTNKTKNVTPATIIPACIEHGIPEVTAAGAKSA